MSEERILFYLIRFLRQNDKNRHRICFLPSATIKNLTYEKYSKNFRILIDIYAKQVYNTSQQKQKKETAVMMKFNYYFYYFAKDCPSSVNPTR